MPIALSVLDQSPIADGTTAADAVRNTLQLAQHCDRLGYHRYWLAEHHASEALAGTAPEVLICRVAGLTSRLRVGSGGVMLPHYSALKVAECFRMLETLFPGRIDLGIGRAPGSDPRTAQLLQPSGQAIGIDHYPYQVRDLMAWLHDAVPESHPGHGVVAQPLGNTAPEVWLLGSSDDSAALAAHFGLPFCFAHFIAADSGAAVTRAYARHFRPSALHDQPRPMMALSVLCAPSDAEADRLALSRDLWAMRLRTTGQPGPIPSLEEALSYPYAESERAFMARLRKRSAVGSPATVRALLEQHAADYGVAEIMVVTICHDFEARVRSYELLAQAFDLRPGA